MPEGEWTYPEPVNKIENVNLDDFIKKLSERLNHMEYGEPKVLNFMVPNSESVYYLNGFAKYVVIHNSGPSDIVISFPNSAGRYYTIPSGEGNANPLVIPNIAPGKVNKLILRSNGVESKVEVLAIMWNSEDTEWW